MDGMSVGLPFITLPMLQYQGLNATLIVHELKVGVEVARQSDGGVGREDICRPVRAVIMPEDGEDRNEVR